VVTDHILSKMYICRICGSKDCKRPWTINFCYKCYGNDAECKICKGSGKIEADMCPRVLSSDLILLPYFYTWYNNEGKVWPDGKAALFQPLKLKEAFSIMRIYIDMLKEERTK